MMTAHGDVPMAARAMRAGAADFVEKPFAAEALLASIAGAMARMTVTGSDPGLRARFDALTPREREVMMQMVAGLPNKRIAHALGMSPRTVEIHRRRVMQKTGVRQPRPTRPPGAPCRLRPRGRGKGDCGLPPGYLSGHDGNDRPATSTNRRATE